MPLPELILLWIITALAARSGTPMPPDPAIAVQCAALAARVFPPASAGEDAWPSMRHILIEIKAAHDAFSDRANRELPFHVGNSIFELPGNAPPSRTTPAENDRITSFRRDTIDELTRRGVWPALARCGTLPRCRPPLFDYRGGFNLEISRLRIAAQCAAQRAAFCAREHDWDGAAEAILAIEACARAAAAQGPFISTLLASSIVDTSDEAQTGLLVHIKPTAAQAESLLAARRGARSLTLSFHHAMEFEVLFNLGAMSSGFSGHPLARGARHLPHPEKDFPDLFSAASERAQQADHILRHPVIAAAAPLFCRYPDSALITRAMLSRTARVFARPIHPAHAVAALNKIADSVWNLPTTALPDAAMLDALIRIYAKVIDTSRRRECVSNASLILLALAAYHAEHSDYPASLDQLAPKYFPDALPRDPLAPDLVFRYRRESPDGFILYTVGFDGEDNNGTPAEEPDSALRDRAPGTDFILGGRATP